MSRIQWRGVLSVLISVVAIAALFLVVDLSQFRAILSRFDWSLVPLAAVSLLIVVLLFGWRWRLLLGRGCSLRATTTATAIGLACNQVLPARGGDLVRAACSARWTGGSLYRAISALVIEKLIDLMAVGIIGAVALLTLFESRREAVLGQPGLVAAGLLVPGAVLVLLVSRTGLLRRIVGALARLVRLQPDWYRHAYRPVFYLERASRARALLAPGLLSLLMWLGPYTYVFHLLPQIVGLGVGWGESMVLLFATSLGLALPAAPSGVGTVHAAVVAGYLMIGRTATEGFVAGTVIHGVFLIAFGAFGLVALVFAPSAPPARSEGVA